MTATAWRKVEDVDERPTPTLAQLITLGLKSESKRTQAAARRAKDAIDKLGRYLAEEKQRKERDAARAAETARARDRIAELEAELTKEKAKLRNAAGGGATTKRSTFAPLVREWAKTNGVDCPAKGIVPRRVLDAYHTANGGPA